MRKSLPLALLLLFLASMTSFGQNFSKLSDEMQQQLTTRTAANEQFRIIINMAENYDQSQMSRQIQYMDKDSRRAFVISELQRFSKSSQNDLMQVLEEGVKAGTVKDVHPFWVFNGISCVANREMIEALAQRNDILLIESDELRNMLPEEWNPVKVKDINRELAWQITQVNADDVWAYNGGTGYDGTGIVVAIIDTGVNYNHLDLADHMWNGGSQYPNHGWDFVNNDNDPIDDHGHGSHCAGIAAGDGTSGTQTGIAPNATVMALKVMRANGQGSSYYTMQAIQFAMNNGADVVSMSLGGSGQSGNPSYRQLFVNMMNAGIVASVAAGNDGEKYNNYVVPRNIGSPGNNPAPWHNPDQTLTGGQTAVITVGASNRNDCKTTFSSFGPCSWEGVSGYNDYPYQAGSSVYIGLIKPDVIAPGADIISCDFQSNNGYLIEAGTSMATPCVSGIIALMLQANPNLTPAQIDEILETTTIPAEFRVTKNNYTGAGRADALSAIDAMFTTATQPTDLSVEICGGKVTLNWTASTSAPAGYCIYRDNVQVATTTETTYSEENLPMGKHLYYVRANDNSDHQSVRSNAVVCIIEPYASTPENLTIGWNDTEATLGWDAATTTCNDETDVNLFYNSTPASAIYFRLNSTNYWGIRFLPEQLHGYKGMSIDQISIGIYPTNLTYTIRIFRGTEHGNTTGAPVYTQTFTPTCGQWGTEHVTLTNPYLIDDISEDLWITCSAPVGSSPVYPITLNTYTGHNSNCYYVSNSSDANNVIWVHMPDYGDHDALAIKAHLTRTETYTPTYSVYLDENSIGSELTETSFTDTPTLHSGENVYYVTSTIGDNESCSSNEAKIVVVDEAETSTEDITIDNSLVYIITPTGVLTAAGELVSTDPERFIIQDGGQLVHSSTNAQVTIEKDITGYNSIENGNWYLISHPMTANLPIDEVTNLTEGNYDLYAFSFSAEDELEWRNFKNPANNRNALLAKEGYLYGHSEDATIKFMGTLRPSNEDESVTLQYDTNEGGYFFNGWNLIGNPFACKAYFTDDMDFYRMNSSHDEIVLNDRTENGTFLAPLEGVFVVATDAGQSATLSSTAPTLSEQSLLNLNLSQTDNKVIDRARVRFGECRTIGKYGLKANSTKLYLPHDGKDLAVARSNGKDEMPVNFKASENGTYTISIDAENVDMDYLHLVDHLTGADIDLLVTPDYTFEAKTTDYTSRFKLVFNPNGETEENESFAFINNGQIVLTGIHGESSLQVIDMTGRIISNETVYSDGVRNTILTPGVYVLRLMTSNNTLTQKIVVE